MDNMTKSGNQNSDSFIKLQARTVALNSRIEQLKKSYTDVSKVSQTVNTHTANFKSKVSELSSSLPLLSIGLAGVAAGIIKFGVESLKWVLTFKELRSNFVGSAQDLELFRKATAGNGNRRRTDTIIKLRKRSWSKFKRSGIIIFTC